MGTVRSNKMVGGHDRPGWAGEVVISDNDPNTIDTIKDHNPRSVRGIILPLTTKGRPSAPVPLSGAITGKAMGTDKGHLMALDLGGPDISANIVPQANLWQQSGGWRSVETNAQLLAMQWMGIGTVYAPGSFIPAPYVAAFFMVAPYPEIDLHTGQPKLYTGTVTKVELVSNGYRPHRDEETHIFYIEPGKVWWERQAKRW